MSKELKVTPKRIRAARIKLGLNLQDAAKRWGFSPHTLQSWENGRRTPSGLYLAKLRRVLKRIALCFGVVLAFAITPLRAQSTVLPSDVLGISCTMGRATAITQHTAGDYLAVLIPYVGLLAACFFVPFAYYRTRKSLTGEARLNANLVNMWRLPC